MLSKMKPAAIGARRGSVTVDELLKLDAPNNRPSQDTEQDLIRAELIGTDICTASGITVEANTPVLQLCRKLITAGHNPATRLEAYRGNVLCLRVRSIGEAAQLEIDGKGCGFKWRAAMGTASLIAPRNEHHRRMRGQS
jgi:hypothetical protein